MPTHSMASVEKLKRWLPSAARTVEVPMDISVLRDYVQLQLEVSRDILKTVPKIETISERSDEGDKCELNEVMKDLVEAASKLSDNANTMGDFLMKYMRR